MSQPYPPPERRRPAWPLLLCAVLALTGIVGGVFALFRLFDTPEPRPYDRQPPPGVQTPSWVSVQLLPPNPFSRPETPLPAVNAIVVHYVANPGSSAQNNRDYFANLSKQRLPTEDTEGLPTATGGGQAEPNPTYSSSHFIIGLQGEIIQCVPLTEVAYCSNSRNGDTLSIEVCHPDETGRFTDDSYNALVKLTGWLCQTYGLTGADLLRHYDVTGKCCPKYFVDSPAAWENFKRHVDEALAADS